jgi:hypothetical protein
MARPKQPSRREVVLSMLRVAGYHEDSASFTRLLIEERISRSVANEQFNNGRAMRSAGVRCDCHACKEAA